MRLEDQLVAEQAAALGWVLWWEGDAIFIVALFTQLSRRLFSVFMEGVVHQLMLLVLRDPGGGLFRCHPKDCEDN